MCATGATKCCREKCAPTWSPLAYVPYRELTRIGGEKVPDDKTMGNLARQLGPEVIEKLHGRVVETLASVPDRAAKQDRNGPQDAGRYDRGGDQYGTYASVSIIRPTAPCSVTACAS